MGLGRKIKQMAEALNGRLKAYDQAGDETELAAAILRNVYRGASDRQNEALHLARYAIAVREHLAGCNPATGKLDFGPPPRLNL